MSEIAEDYIYRYELTSVETMPPSWKASNEIEFILQMCDVGSGGHIYGFIAVRHRKLGKASFYSVPSSIMSDAFKKRLCSEMERVVKQILEVTRRL